LAVATAAEGWVMTAVTFAVPVVPLPRNGIVATQLAFVDDCVEVVVLEVVLSVPRLVVH
jgi:hypothetical protein